MWLPLPPLISRFEVALRKNRSVLEICDSAAVMWAEKYRQDQQKRTCVRKSIESLNTTCHLCAAAVLKRLQLSGGDVRCSYRWRVYNLLEKPGKHCRIYRVMVE